MALPKFNSNTFRAAALSGLMFVAPAFAESRNVEVSHTKATPVATYIDATSQAQQYARENNAIGIVLGFGDFEGAIDPEIVGQNFKSALANRGEESTVFIVRDGTPGYVIAFAFGVSGMGPMSINEAVKSIDEIVASKNRMSDLLAAAPN